MADPLKIQVRVYKSTFGWDDDEKELWIAEAGWPVGRLEREVALQHWASFCESSARKTEEQALRELEWMLHQRWRTSMVGLRKVGAEIGWRRIDRVGAQVRSFFKKMWRGR